jgi:hypothetical protein
MVNRPADPAQEIASLAMLAAWYRAWAKLTDSEAERAERLALADGIERRIARLRAASTPSAES